MNAFYGLLKKQIESKDANNEINNKIVWNISYNQGEYQLEYNKGIKIEGQLRPTLESVVVAYIVTKLVKDYGYPMNSITIEKRRPTGTTSTFFDIVVTKDKETIQERPLCIIFEVKQGKLEEKEKIEAIKNQLIEPAFSLRGTKSEPFPKFLVYYQVWSEANKSYENEEIKEEIKVIDFDKIISIPSSEKEIKEILSNNFITNNKIPYYSEPWTTAYKNLFVKDSDNDLIRFNDPQEITKIIREVKDLIWRGGKLKTERAFKFIIRLLLTKLYDEQFTEPNKEYALQVKPGDSENLDEFVKRINDIYKKALADFLSISMTTIEKENILTIEYEREGKPITIDKQILLEVVKKIQRYRFKADDKSIDLLGEFFERFLWDEYKQEKGQFFTHPSLVRFTIDMLNLPKEFLEKLKQKKFPYILDPSCGSGTFLVEAMKSINKEINNQHYDILGKTPYKNMHWAYAFLYGIDVEKDLVLSSKVNMIMHGDGSGSIFEADALGDLEKMPFVEKIGDKVQQQDDKVTKKLYEKFHYIITNPPFSLPLGEIDANTIKNNFILADNFDKQIRGKSKSSEIFFVERWYQLLEEGGKIGAVLPESVFDTLEYLHLRLFILFRFKIKAIISLPEHAFAPFAAQRTNLFFAEKRNKEDTLKLISAFEHLHEYIDQDDELFISEVSKIQSLNNDMINKIKEIKKEDISNEAKAYKILLEIFPKEKYEFFIAQVEDIGYLRTKKGYKESSNNNLPIVVEDFRSWEELQNKKFKFAYSRTISTEFVCESDDLRLDVKFLLRNRDGKQLNELFDLTKVQKIKDIQELFENTDKISIKYVETGDIGTKGEINYIEIFKSDLESKSAEENIEEDREEKETTFANYARIINKIKDGNIGQLEPNCLIIAPARVYQSKIAIVDDYFSKNFYFSLDFIVLKPKIDVEEAFLLLKSKYVTGELNKVSRIGKSGYPKIRLADLKYVKIPEEVINECKNLEKKRKIKELFDKRKELFKLMQEINFD